MKRTPIKRKTKLKPVSSKRYKELTVYIKNRIIFLSKQRNRWCNVCTDRALEMPQDICNINLTMDIHHKNGRIGSMLNDKRYWLSVCRECHTKIHANPKWARENGYLV
jgi:hypothetical protein